MSTTSPTASPARTGAAPDPVQGFVIHVRPTAAGDWEVRPDDCDAPVSIHPTADAAERAATAEAAARGGVVAVRDRYSRIHLAGAA